MKTLSYVMIFGGMACLWPLCLFFGGGLVALAGLVVAIIGLSLPEGKK